MTSERIGTKFVCWQWLPDHSIVSGTGKNHLEAIKNAFLNLKCIRGHNFIIDKNTYKNE